MDFCDTLKASGQLVFEYTEADDTQARIEGFRLLSRLVRGGLETCLEAGDPRFPLVNTLPNQVKIGTSDRFLCPGGPKVPSSNPPSPTEGSRQLLKTAWQVSTTQGDQPEPKRVPT